MNTIARLAQRAAAGPPGFRTDNARSLRDLAYEALKTAIADTNIYDPSQELRLDERQLGMALGISRTPAREAIRQLVSEGLLESVPGRGVVVITLDRDDIRELFEMREALEGLAARTVAGRTPSAGEIRDLRSIALALTSLINAAGR